MINLLPPETKTQMRFASYNAKLAHYLKIGIALAVALAALFFGAHWYVGQQISAINSEIASRNNATAPYGKLLKEAAAVNSRLASYKTIVAGQSKFSLLLGDLAKATPQGVAIDAITLTGDDKKPVKLTALASSYEAALGFRDSLAASPRIGGADLETITRQDDGTYKVSVSIAFNPGQSR